MISEQRKSKKGLQQQMTSLPRQPTLKTKAHAALVPHSATRAPLGNFLHRNKETVISALGRISSQGQRKQPRPHQQVWHHTSLRLPRGGARADPCCRRSLSQKKPIKNIPKPIKHLPNKRIQSRPKPIVGPQKKQKYTKTY